MQAEQAYIAATSADVVDPNAFNWYSRMLASVGRLDDSLEQALIALEMDPTSAVINSRVAAAYLYLGETATAKEFYERSEKYAPGFYSQRHDYTKFAGTLQYRHQLSIENTECHQDNEHAVHKPGAGKISLNGLLQTGMQGRPVQYNQSFTVIDEVFNCAHRCGNLIQVVQGYGNTVAMITHGKRFLEISQWNFGDAAIHVV